MKEKSLIVYERLLDILVTSPVLRIDPWKHTKNEYFDIIASNVYGNENLSSRVKFYIISCSSMRILIVEHIKKMLQQSSYSLIAGSYILWESNPGS